MTRLTDEEIHQVLPSVAEALRKVPVNGEVTIKVDAGRVTLVEAKPRLRTWKDGRRLGGQAPEEESA
jgi:hypothetical protein